jgi:tRNA A-37 threonylcarbamoyl transferase component Bud32
MSPWVVPGYTEEKQLGRGASGRVVAAIHQASGQRVAIKYLAPKLFRDPDFLVGFRAEADLLRSLDVPYIVRLFDYIEAPGQGAAIVMELVDGVSLHEMISRRGATSPESALVVLKGSLLGLAAAHALGIVHRDYKPENVLVDREGTSKLSDFGVAVREGRQVPSAGTPLYMAPEQWDGMPSSPATDIYAASAVFFECLTGKTPFSGRLGQLHAQHAAAAVPVEMVDEPLRGLIARGMAKDPVARPVNAMEFVTELEFTAVAAYGADWEERGRRHLAERAAALLLLLLGASAVAGGVGAAAAASWLARHKPAAISIAAITTAALVGVAVSAVALTGGGGPRSTVTINQAGNGSASPSGSGVNSVAPGSSAATFDAMVTAMPPVATSACATPTSFTYSADLSSTGPGTVTYKWVYSTGKSGPAQTAHFAAAGTQQVSGGTVSARKASTGWGAIQILSAGGVLSNKATYKLVCSAPAAGTVGLSAFVTPGAETVACGSPTPSFAFTGLISDSKAGTVTYHWALSDGATSPAQTLTFSGAGTQEVQQLSVTPPADTASGAAMLVVTSPGTATSSPAFYSLTCTKNGTAAPPPLHLSAAAQASPATSMVGCDMAAPTITFTGTIKANEATKVSYYWKLPSGNGPTRTLTFTKAGTLSVSSATYTPSGDTASGSGTIVITGPMGATSAPASFTLTCDQANVSVSLSSTPASPDSVACGSTPPAFTLTGSLTSSQALSGVKYEWLRPNGTTGSSGTISLAAGTSKTVTDKFTSPSDSFTGSEELEITAPFVTKESLPVAVSCTYPELSLSPVADGDLPDGTVGVLYPVATLTATGGEAPYTWSATSLPAGLSINPATGAISGTPEESGTFMVVAMVHDSQAPDASASEQLTLVIEPPAPQVSVAGITSDPASPVTGTCGDAAPTIVVQASLTARSATSVTYRWARSVGTTTAPQTVNVTPDGATVTDDIEMATTANTWSLTDTLEVTAPNATSKSISLSYSCSYPKLAIQSDGLPAAQDGSEYSQGLSATGGDGTYDWAVSGLPAGLHLSGDTISGTPTAAGRFPVTVTVTDGETPTPQTASTTLTLSVADYPALDITTGALPECNFDGDNPGCPATQLAATGGNGHYTWSATGLPGGVSVSPGGVLSGDPTKPGTYQVTITVLDGESPAMSKSVQLPLVVNDES